MKYLKALLLLISIFLGLNLIITILSYFDIFNSKTIHILKILSFIISFISSSIYIGFNSKKKAYIEGIKNALIFILISFVFTILLPNFEFSIKLFIYYLIIILINIVGSTLGINLKKTKK